MDFDEYDYLEQAVEPNQPSKEEANGGSEEIISTTQKKERRRSSRHTNDDENVVELDHHKSKLSKSTDRSHDIDTERRGSSRRRSSPGDRRREHRDKERDSGQQERNGKDRVRDGNQEKDIVRSRDRDRDRERDYDVDKRERHHGSRDERDKERERSRRSRSHSERHRVEQVPEKSLEVDYKDREREKEFKGGDRENRRYNKEKKENGVEPEVDPERDQRTVFAYQISLKADERDVYDFFSRAGKVRDVRLIMDRNSRRSKGVGYVEFFDAMSVPMAIALSGQPLLGQPVMVKPSEAEKNLVQSTASTAGVVGGLTGPFSGGARKLYVGNLHFNMKEDQLRQVFESFGTVELVQLPTDTETGHCKGFGFVQFARLEDARAAQSLNGQLEIAGRIIKVSAVTDQVALQDIGTNTGDLDDDEGGGLALNANSRALLMQKLDRSGAAPSIPGSAAPIPAAVTPQMNPLLQVSIPGLPGIGVPIPSITVPSVDSVGVPSECVLLKNMFDPSIETEQDFDLDIKEDVQEECSKFGPLNHIYVDKHTAGFVYLRFENTESAMNAQRALHGRWFAGKMITATFMLPQNYEAQFPESSR